jgi:hypothetical protein
MFKTLLTGTCLLAVLAGCASAPQNRVASADSPPKGCLASGSRIPLGKDQCAAMGQSYSGDELRETGKDNTADALRMVDPVVH